MDAADGLLDLAQVAEAQQRSHQYQGQVLDPGVQDLDEFFPSHDQAGDELLEEGLSLQTPSLTSTASGDAHQGTASPSRREQPPVIIHDLIDVVENESILRSERAEMIAWVEDIHRWVLTCYTEVRSATADKFASPSHSDQATAATPGTRDFPDTSRLRQYRKDFFAVCDKALPFSHSALNVRDPEPAVNLAQLAAGATSGGQPSIGANLFVTPRCAMSAYLRDHGIDSIPLWIVKVLLLNFAFGPPCSSVSRIRRDSESLAWHLHRARPPPPSRSTCVTAGDCSPDQRWRSFAAEESYHRTLGSVFVVIGLWSAVYGFFQCPGSSTIDSVRMPCPEPVWQARDAQSWHQLHGSMAQPLLLRDAVQHLFNGDNIECSGLASLCAITGLLTHAMESREGTTLRTDDLDLHLRLAADTWAASHDPAALENSTINCIAYPTLAHLRLSLEVEAPTVMAQLLRREPMQMRRTLREGSLRRAVYAALDCLVPWSAKCDTGFPIVFLPSGMCMNTASLRRERLERDLIFALAIVVSECFAMLLEQREKNGHAGSQADDALWGVILEKLGLLDRDGMGPLQLWVVLERSFRRTGKSIFIEPCRYIRN